MPETPHQPPQAKVKRRTLLLGLSGLGAVAAGAYFPVERHLAALRLLQAMQKEDRTKAPVPGQEFAGLRTEAGLPFRARVYGPRPEDARLAVVLGHGIHYQGIEEPRLIRFARHLAALDVHVLTPALADLADYRVTATGVDVLNASVAHLSSKASDPVGLIGFSFAGGLSLLAAQDPKLGPSLRYVASIGGYLDLGRTLRFLATNRVEGPMGSTERKAHEYGLLVLLFQHLDELNLGPQTGALRDALRAWLQEDRPAAFELKKALHDQEPLRLFSLVEEGKLVELAPVVLSLLKKKTTDLARLSPEAGLHKIRAPLLFLHGAGDSVVPPEETLWAAHVLKRAGSSRHLALVTPLLEHVRVDQKASVNEQWKLLHLVAQLL